jgi:hypothetical protein
VSELALRNMRDSKLFEFSAISVEPDCAGRAF